MGSGALSPRSLPDTFNEEQVKEMLADKFQEGHNVLQKFKDKNGHISKANLLKYKEVFLLFNNETKTANVTQLTEAIKGLGYELLSDDLDHNTKESSSITFILFCSILEKKLDIIAGFEKFDKNHDGKIDVKEIMQTMKEDLKDPITKQEAKDLLKAADTNNDGSLDIKEFTQMMTTES